MTIYAVGDITTATEKIAHEILDHLDELGLALPKYGPPHNQPVVWGYNSGGKEHGTGRALDFMVDDHTEVGHAIVKFVWANRERYDLTHIIWRRRIKSTKIAPGTWRWMEDRGGPTKNHMDHPHLFFGPNALASTGGTQSIPAPDVEPGGAKPAPRYPLPRGHYFGPKSGPVSSVSGYYSHRSDLRRWQQRMHDRGWTITADGLYGPQTKSVAVAFQREKGLAVDGLIGPATWDATWTAPVT